MKEMSENEKRPDNFRLHHANRLQLVCGVRASSATWHQAFRGVAPQAASRDPAHDDAANCPELQCDGVINRAVYAEVPPQFDYSLGKFGSSLVPVLIAMRDRGRSPRVTLVVTREAPGRRGR